jgi:hypothetical protein
LKCGLAVGEFYDLTLRETLAAIEAAAWRAEQQQRRDIALAWHVAAFSRTRRMPSLRSVLARGETQVLQGEDLERRREEHREMMANLDMEKLRGT